MSDPEVIGDRERFTAASAVEVRAEEVGRPLKEVADGLGLRVIRDGTAYPTKVKKAGVIE